MNTQLLTEAEKVSHEKAAEIVRGNYRKQGRPQPAPAVGQEVTVTAPNSRHAGQSLKVVAVNRNERGVWVTLDLPETQTHVACKGTFSAHELRWVEGGNPDSIGAGYPEESI